MREIWRADGSRLVRIGFETDNAAAAEYYAYNGGVTRTASGFDVQIPHLAVAALPIRIDQVGNHRLRFSDDEISLAEQVDGSVAATMSVEQETLLEWLLGDRCG